MSTLNAFLARAFPSWLALCRLLHGDGGGESPYQGVLAARIGFGRGQSGACAAERATQVQAEDVSVCANYIPCDDVTRSEIVVPVFGRSGHHAEPEVAPPAPGASCRRRAASLPSLASIRPCSATSTTSASA